MADVTVTAANVRPKSGATVQPLTAGGTITAGDVVYQDSADSSKAKRADTTTAAKAAAVGIAVTNAATDEIVYVLTAGNIDVGGTLAVGEIYTCSDNAGKIAPAADNGTGDFVTILGVADSASNLQLEILASGVAHA